MFCVIMTQYRETSENQNPPEPKPWVCRLVIAQGLSVTEKQLGWWFVHLESLLRYCLKQSEKVEARILARAFYDLSLRSQNETAKRLIL